MAHYKIISIPILFVYLNLRTQIYTGAIKRLGVGVVYFIMSLVTHYCFARQEHAMGCEGKQIALLRSRSQTR